MNKFQQQLIKLLINMPKKDDMIDDKLNKRLCL